MHKRDFVAIGSWIGIALSLWILAWIIAEAIPVFSNLLSLIVCVSASCNSCDILTPARPHSSPVGSHTA